MAPTVKRIVSGRTNCPAIPDAIRNASDTSSFLGRFLPPGTASSLWNGTSIVSEFKLPEFRAGAHKKRLLTRFVKVLPRQNVEGRTGSTLRGLSVPPYSHEDEHSPSGCHRYRYSGFAGTHRCVRTWLAGARLHPGADRGCTQHRFWR